MSEPATNAREEGLRLLQAGELDQARSRLQTAVTHDPSDGRAHSFLGICEARRGNLAGSLASLEQAARLMPQDPTAAFNLANALVQAQQLEQARRFAEYALSLKPDYPAAQQLLARLDASQPEAAPPASVAASPNGFAPLGTPDPASGQWAASAGSAAPQSWSVPEATQQAWSSAPPSPVPAPSQGLTFDPSTQAKVEYEVPGPGRRVARGLGWGILYGQWWTLWMVISTFLWGHGSFSTIFVIVMAAYAIGYGLIGSVTGLVIGAANADFPKAQIIGVVAGLLTCGVEVLLSQNPMMLVNVIFYFITGRFVGVGIAGRVRQLVPR